ncbi:N-acetyltransferase [Marmoricola endophyticus]|uniref:N-acetyltransferase n=1 Tax=Marmoricola endophyticus TaxID=2040280 RepID=A0A917BN70_9ACTN|nr:GNAT family N-acetyltransferase [Marmoricola endophyticus]GGF50363.1 N-acetyltransferase [Marmoricola endophyticus]
MGLTHGREPLGPGGKHSAGPSRTEEPETMTATDLSFEPLEAGARDRWLESVFADYVRHRVAAGDTEREARQNAADSRERWTPGGVPTPGQQIGRILEDGEPVGHLWIGPLGADPTRWMVVDIVIDPSLRGRGLGRRTMVLAEQVAREHGASSLALNVFAVNTTARRLYDSLGYEEASVFMRKPL